MANFILAITAHDNYAGETFDVDGDLWTATDAAITVSRHTSDPVRSSVMKFVGDSWALGDGITLGDGYYLGDSEDGKGEGVYEDYTVTAGSLYAFSCLYKIGSAGAYLTIEIYDQTNEVSISSVDVTDTTWQSREEQITAPSGCTTIRVKFLQKSDLRRGGPFYIDNVRLDESALVYDPEEYSRTPIVVGDLLQTLGGRRVHDKTCIHYSFRLWWEFLEKAQTAMLIELLTSNSLLYLDDLEVPALTETQAVHDTATEKFVGVENPSSTNKAYTDNSASLPSAEADFDSTEFSTAQYQAIDVDDANYHETSDPDATKYLYHRFDFDPDIDASDFQRFRVKVVASCDDASPDNNDGCVLYIWNDTDSTWVELAQSSSSAKTDLEYTTAESDVAQSFGDSSTQRIKLLLRSRATRTSGSSLTLRTYYAEVEVNENLDDTVDLSHSAVLDDDSDVIHVKNTTQGTLLKHLVEYTVASDRRSVTAGAVYATLNGSTHRFDGGDVLDAGVGDISFSAWVKMDGNPAANSVIAQKFTSGAGYSVFIGTGGQLRGAIEDSGGSVLSTADGAEITDNVWHHVAITFDRDGDMTRYVDGVAYGSTDDISAISGNVDNAVDFVVGANSAANNYFFEGSLRDIRIWIGDLWSAAEVVIQAANPGDNSVGGTNTSSWYFTDAASDTDITDDTASNDLALAGGDTTDYSTHTRDRAVDSGDSVEVKYDRRWEVSITGLPERILNGDPGSDRVRDVEVFLATLSPTPIN